MNFYDTWAYREVLNAGWFVRVLVWTVLLGNVFMPAIIWFLFSGQSPWRRPRAQGRQQQKPASRPKA